MDIPDMVTVEENVAIGTDVLTLNSTDLDGDANPVYEVASQSSAGVFKINADNTKLVTNSSIDYETDQNLTVTIRYVPFFKMFVHMKICFVFVFLTLKSIFSLDFILCCHRFNNKRCYIKYRWI
jgi:hypothetical protein